MSNILKIKRALPGGATVPASPLAEGEMAYAENGDRLYIGTSTGDNDHIGGKSAMTKLDAIEAGADVTDSTNVDAAGAVMNSDSSTAAMSFVIDEDTLASNLATKVPTQQSVKAYVDNKVAAGINYKGGYNAATNTPNLDATPIAIALGDMYTVTAAGTFFTAAVEIGDVLVAEAASAATLADWTIIQANIVFTAAEIKTMYESNADTNAFTDAMVSKLVGIAEGAQVNVATNLTWTAGTTAGPVINSSTGTGQAIPAASATASGAVTTDAQTFAGTKTFTDISGTDVGAVLDSFVIDGGSF